MAKKNCMFQCTLTRTSPFWGYLAGVDIVENTDLISWEEAVKLWIKWKPQVISQLEDNQNAEMCIWTACNDSTDYHTDAFHVNQNTKVENGEFIECIRNIINPTKEEQ